MSEYDEWSDEQRYVYGECHEALTYGEIISRDVAMVIASWWHSPASPNSTRLSTMGQVACDAELSDFATKKDFEKQNLWDKWALNCLAAFIKDAQEHGLVVHTDNCPELS